MTFHYGGDVESCPLSVGVTAPYLCHVDRYIFLN